MKYMARNRKTWGECVKPQMKLLDLLPEWAIFTDMWRDFILGKRLTLAEHGRKWKFTK